MFNRTAVFLFLIAVSANIVGYLEDTVNSKSPFSFAEMAIGPETFEDLPFILHFFDCNGPNGALGFAIIGFEVKNLKVYVAFYSVLYYSSSLFVAYFLLSLAILKR
jgi:hypothetical protein